MLTRFMDTAIAMPTATGTDMAEGKRRKVMGMDTLMEEVRKRKATVMDMAEEKRKKNMGMGMDMDMHTVRIKPWKNWT